METGKVMTGRLARSRAGHDKGGLYVVVREEGEWLWLADGVRRGLLNLKKKKRKHVQPAGRAFTEEETVRFFQNPAWADNMIRERISQEESGKGKPPAAAEGEEKPEN